jgi:hypothetical protein
MDGAEWLFCLGVAERMRDGVAFPLCWWRFECDRSMVDNPAEAGVTSLPAPRPERPELSREKKGWTDWAE